MLTYAATLLFSLKTHKALFAGQPGAGKARAHFLARTRGDAPRRGDGPHRVPGELPVGSIAGARHNLGLTQTFVGVIVVALVGNAAEHTTAVWAALKNQMDLSLSIAVGSSLQVALFVTPMLVFASYAFGRPMDLEFSLPEIVAIAVAIWIAQQVSGDGESNWLEGVQLLSVYLIMAILFPSSPRSSTQIRRTRRRKLQEQARQRREGRWGESLTAEKMDQCRVGETEAGLPGRIPRMDGRWAPEALHPRRYAG